MTGKPIIRPATPKDISPFLSDDFHPTINAWCMEVDGEVLALGGVCFVGGRWLAFASFPEEARKYKITLARAMKRFFESLKQRGIKYVYAERDNTEPSSLRLLTQLGFFADPRTANLLRWEWHR